MPRPRKNENPLRPASSTQESRMSVGVQGQRIAQLRKERGWNQERLAAEAGCNVRTVQNAEASGHIILRTLTSIATALGVTPNDILKKRSGALRLEGESGRKRMRALTAERPSGLPLWADLDVRQSWAFDEADVEVDGEDVVKATFHELWWPESSRGWTSTITKGAYRLQNEHGKRDDRRWVDFSPEDGHLSSAPVSVEVCIEQDAPSFGSGAGLLYRFQPGRTRFYSLLLTGDGQVRFAVRRKDGETNLYKTRSDAVRRGEFNKLAIASEGADLFLFVNETLVKIVHNEELTRGGVGIVASGTGRFAFRNLMIYTAS